MGARRRRLNKALVAGEVPDSDYFDEPTQRHALSRGKTAEALAADSALGRSVGIALFLLFCGSIILLVVHRVLST